MVFLTVLKHEMKDYKKFTLNVGGEKSGFLNSIIIKISCIRHITVLIINMVEM